MSRPAEVIIDLAALAYNFAHIRALAPDSSVMAIVKADAYGHGIVPIAESLATAEAFGVACLEEARQLRQAGIRQDITLLEGPYAVKELAEISALGLDIVVHDIVQLKMLEQIHLSKPVGVWLKLDTGMHRLGFPPEAASQILTRLQRLDNIKDIRLMTHLANACDRNSDMTSEQLRYFGDFSAGLNLQKTIANSAAIMAFPETHVDWVRPGIMLYGVSPFNDHDGLHTGLRPVMTLKSELITVKELRSGSTVGYGAAWRCPEDMLIGVIAVGYGDGYPRHARSGTPVLVNNSRVELIGHVSMDMLAVDLRSQPDAKIGDSAILWGQDLPVEEVARHAETIPYELLCGVNQRLNFHYSEA